MKEIKKIKEFINNALMLLDVAFNLTAVQQRKIINRYIHAVTNEINSKQVNFNSDGSTYFVSLHNIGSKSRSSINKRQQEMHSWFMDNCPLFKIVTLGNNLEKKFTEISMYYQVNTTIDSMYTTASSGGELELEDAIEHLYGKELAEIIYLGKEELYDIAKIDLKSLKAFIDTTNTYIAKNKRVYYNTDKLERRVREAKRIYTLASVCNGHLIQIINESEFGRRFYKGPNLQSVHKDVRHAALGKCIEYDINNSVYAWRLYEAKKISKEFDGELIFPATIDYMDRKEYIRESLAANILQETNLTLKFKKRLIKQVFTAIGFGAQGSSTPAFWDADGERTTFAINDLIKNTNDRKRFFDHSFIKEFMQEQRYISKIIFAVYGKQYTDVEILQNTSGKVSEAKLLAYLYQHIETTIMDDALSHIPPDDILLRCHDAFYVSTISTDDILEVKYKLQKYIPTLSLHKTEVSEWVTVDPRFTKVIKENEDRHKQIIANETAKAMNYVPKTLNVIQMRPKVSEEDKRKIQAEEDKKEIARLEEQVLRMDRQQLIMEQLLKDRGLD